MKTEREEGIQRPDRKTVHRRRAALVGALAATAIVGPPLIQSMYDGATASAPKPTPEQEVIQDRTQQIVNHNEMVARLKASDHPAEGILPPDIATPPTEDGR